MVTFIQQVMRESHTHKKNVRQREGHVQYRIDKKNDVPTQIGIYTAEITAETIDDSSKSGTCVRVVIFKDAVIRVMRLKFSRFALELRTVKVNHRTSKHTPQGF